MQYFAPTLLDRQVYDTSGGYTWTNPVKGGLVRVRLLSGGGGGGAGARGAAGTLRGGGGGGSGGIYVEAWFLGADLPPTVPVSVGAGGLGGTAVTTDNTQGNSVASGGATTFGSPVLLRANPGSGAFATTTLVGGYGGGPGGIAGIVTATKSWLPGTGGFGSDGSAIGLTNAAPIDGCGYLIGPGGGGGGGVGTADIVRDGGGGRIHSGLTTGATAGVGGTAGANGGTGTITTDLNTARYAILPAASGGGGAASITGVAGSGAPGVGYGAGGGGGGASLNGNNSGAGGAGSSGLVIIEVYS